MSDYFEDDFSDFDTFNDGYNPDQVFVPGLETLADGDYNFTIEHAELTRASNNDRILNLVIRPDGGSQYKYTYWLNKQVAINRLGADMCILGFDADKWGQNGQPLSRAIPAVVSKLPGKRFAAKKATNESKDGRAFHNLFIDSTIAGNAPQAPKQAGWNDPSSGPANADDEIIPF